MNSANKGNPVVIRNLHKSFGKKRVLNGLDLDVKEGEVIGILGRNGSGKTTLFKIILDIISPDTGGISVLGSIPDGSGRIRRLTGYIPEKPAFHDLMTVAEVLSFRAKLFKNWNLTKASELCAKLELGPELKIKDLSKGSLGKLAWISAAAHNPPLLLLDEPTSGLDYLIRDHLLNNLIEELANGGKTILIASHRLGEMAGILDKVCLLAEGKIQKTYGINLLKEEAYRVTARLTGETKEENIRVMSRNGALTELAVFGKETLAELQNSRDMKNAEIRPLDIETALKVLLGE